MPLSEQTYFCTHTKRISFILCSGLERNSWYISSTSHIDTSTTYCQVIIHTLRIISVGCIPLSLKSKTQQRATLLFLASTPVDRDKRGDFNFHITNSPFLRSKILRQPMAFLSTAQTICHGLLLLWMFYS